MTLEREETGDQIIQSIVCYAKDFGLFPNVTGKPWKHFKWENSMIIFIFQNSHSGCIVGNRLEGDEVLRRPTK